jgi:CubicO group peptidase (beta-lactamase class C family)
VRTPARIVALFGLAASSACVDTGTLAGPTGVAHGADIPAALVAANVYFPPSEGAGGWRRLVSANATPTAQQKSDIRSIAGLDWDLLKQAWDGSSQYGGSFIVIRHGYIAAEWGISGAIPVASCTKTLTSLGIHRMFQMSAQGTLGVSVGPEDFAYRYLAPSWGEDATRRTIRIRHLLTMSSGLEPDDSPPSPTTSTAAYQQKLLAPPVRTTPGAEWSYASLPVDVLSLMTENITGLTLGNFWQQQIGSVIGVASLQWGALGPHTYASAYASMTGRDMARVAYLLLQRGSWNGTSIVSGDRIDRMTQWDPALGSAVYGPQIKFPTDPNSQKRYGRLVWTNRTESPYVGAGVPADAYYCAGYRTKFAVVVPSEDLIIVRLQDGPVPWSDAVFTGINEKVVSAIVEAPANVAPTVQITSPAPRASFPAGSDITIAAIAGDADGGVTQVAFFAGSTPLGTDVTAPYSHTWSGVAPGSYSLTARATDTGGATTTSAAVMIKVRKK